MSAKIYEPKGKAREYSPYALNYYKGCSHDCLYCYVPKMFNRFDSNYKHEIVELRKSIPDILKSVELSAKKHNGKQVLLNFTSDPYNSLEEDTLLTRKILKILLKYQIPVSVLTKNPKLAYRDIDLYKKFNSFTIGTTLVFHNDKLSEKWEKGAITSNERADYIGLIKNKGIKTWASFEPVIIPNESLDLLDYVGYKKYVNYVKIGKLNNYNGIDKTINWTKFLNDAVNIVRKYKIPFYIKKDLLKFKDKSLYLSDNEKDQDFLTLKAKKTLTNQLF